MLRTVLLRHDLPDGSWHYDWMLELPSSATSPPTPDPENPDLRPLMTFRTTDRPDDAGAFPLHAERLADHRRLYLTYEGEVSGGRGHVARIAQGTYTATMVAESALELAVRFAPWRQPLLVRGEGRGEIWIFSLRQDPGSRKMA